MKEMTEARRTALEAKYEARRVKRLNRLSLLKCILNFEDAVFTAETPTK
jgi:hypothetical protein